VTEYISAVSLKVYFGHNLVLKHIFDMTKINKDRTFIILRCQDDESISKCALAVREGGVIVYPTDTVYGIGCDPYNSDAAKRIFSMKGRKEDSPFPVLASSVEQVEKIAYLDKRGRSLAKKYWPGGLTLLCPLLDSKISQIVTAGRQTIAVRIPKNKCTLLLLELCQYLVGTSANRSGHPASKNVNEILSSSLRGFDIILDGGQARQGVQSTIVNLLKSGCPDILREGVIKSQQILSTLSKERLI
jgi:L-threonylcarbamoyladenylate synthase